MVALGVDLGEISLRRFGVKIGARLLDGRLLQLVFGAQASECRVALLEHRFGVIGRARTSRSSRRTSNWPA